MPAGFKMVFLPPQSDQTRQWAEAVAQAVPDATIVVAENEQEALREIPDTDAVFGGIPPQVLAESPAAQVAPAPQIAPPAGFYYDDLVNHPCIATNFRGIFNEHIAAHILAFVLALCARVPLLPAAPVPGRWTREPNDTGIVYLPESTALILGVGGIGGETAKDLANLGVRVIGIDARREDTPEGVAELHRPDELDDSAAAGRLRHPDDPTHPTDRGTVLRRAFREDEAVRVLHQHRARQDDRSTTWTGRSATGRLPAPHWTSTRSSRCRRITRSGPRPTC